MKSKIETYAMIVLVALIVICLIALLAADIVRGEFTFYKAIGFGVITLLVLLMAISFKAQLKDDDE